MSVAPDSPSCPVCGASARAGSTCGECGGRVPKSPPAKPKPKRVTIASLLRSRGFTITRMGGHGGKDPALDTLSLLLMFQFPYVEHLLKAIRSGGPRDCPGFTLSMEAVDDDHRTMLTNLGFLLLRNGLLSEFRVSPKRDEIRGLVAPQERAIQFLDGRWLERAILVCLGGFLNLENHRVEYALNTEVRRPPSPVDGFEAPFEFDLLLRVDGHLFWWEAKSGQFDPAQIGRYRTIADELELPADHCFLVLAGNPKNSNHVFQRARHGLWTLRPEDIPLVVESIEGAFRRAKATGRRGS
ncbi:MAG: hypothetical protein KDM64_06685 [Verrucomicrobiae bacterium]|nr:hypothetical protein [Verrucomicrobiae bacterium]